MSKKDNKVERDNHSGSTAAEDSELTMWLNRLWALSQPPERVELWQAFGRNGLDRGELIHHEDFKPNEKLNVEQANKLANEIMAAAQYDCDCRRKESSYQLCVIDRNRKATPLVRRIGPIQPKRSYALKTLDSLNDEDEDGPQDAKSVELAYIKEGLEQSRWDKNRYDKVMGEMLMLQGSIIVELRQQNQTLFAQNMTMIKETQELQDRSLDREIARDRARFTLNLWNEGVRSAKNLLPGFFGPSTERPPIAGDQTNGNSNGTNGNGTKDYGPSAERALVNNFLNDCEETKGTDGKFLSITLFGDFEEKDGKMCQVAPGVFTLKQYRVLSGVCDGRMPANALDVLLPGSGHENAIQEEQINKSLAAGVTAGIGLALREVFELRKQAKQARETATASANGAHQTDPATPEETL